MVEIKGLDLYGALQGSPHAQLTDRLLYLYHNPNRSLLHVQIYSRVLNENPLRQLFASKECSVELPNTGEKRQGA